MAALPPLSDALGPTYYWYFGRPGSRAASIRWFSTPTASWPGFPSRSGLGALTLLLGGDRFWLGWKWLTLFVAGVFLLNRAVIPGSSPIPSPLHFDPAVCALACRGLGHRVSLQALGTASSGHWYSGLCSFNRLTCTRSTLPRRRGALLVIQWAYHLDYPIPRFPWRVELLCVPFCHPLIQEQHFVANFKLPLFALSVVVPLLSVVRFLKVLPHRLECGVHPDCGLRLRMAHLQRCIVKVLSAVPERQI